MTLSKPELKFAVKRDYDATRLNRVINDSSVFPWIALPGQKQGELDASAVAGDLRNYVLMTDSGGLVAHWSEPGLYEIHTQFLSTCRGRDALRATQDAVAYLFLFTDAVEILTKIPVNNPAAVGLVRLLRGKLEFRRDAAWPCVDGSLCDVEYYGLRYADWARNNSDWLRPWGEWFHHRLEAEKATLGVIDANHADDASHDAAVGATVCMALAGNVDKGVALYNRWARFAGYGQVGIVGRVPLLLNIGDSLVEIKNGDFTVLKAWSLERPERRERPEGTAALAVAAA